MGNSRKHTLLALVIAVSAVETGCFSKYADDCDRNVELDCFWAGAGGTGGTGTPPPACGDGNVDSGEVCDDGNEKNCDGCRGDCSAVEKGCGDGFTCGGEECDNGAANDDLGVCLKTCQKPFCGDGIIRDGEVCDDGNYATNDGCVDCQLECSAGNLPVGNQPDVNAEAYSDPDTLHCYVRVDNPRVSWESARQACKAWGGNLAGLSTSEEHSVVYQQLKAPGDTWTGGNDLEKPNQFEWVNGEPWPASPPWASGQPDGEGNAQGCVALDSAGTLDDSNCITLNRYLCERILVPPPPAP